MSEKLSKIRLIARIMPSPNAQKNQLLMDWVNLTTENEKKDSPNSVNVFNRSLHFYNNTKNYFPTLNLQPEFVPVGDSKTMCINLAWTPKEKWRDYDKYK